MMYSLYFKSLIRAIIKKILLPWKRSELNKGCICVTDRWTKFLHVAWLFHLLTQVQLSKLYIKFIVSSHIHLLFTKCIKKCVLEVCITKCFSRETEPTRWRGFRWCFIHKAGEHPLQSVVAFQWQWCDGFCFTWRESVIVWEKGIYICLWVNYLDYIRCDQTYSLWVVDPGLDFGLKGRRVAICINQSLLPS